ncbi:DUF192 domain-containing protein [Paremcibacter congregatus]|uniref:DUF192 domain-containing protein n=1 Tax=Paremcibacter congregatus TaxID=2043170 RepID=UPI0030EE1299|tara:strand:- start:5436 stop:5945 length:510 start_codon:yes stop_codon:yes gene_type:complete
MKFSRHIILRFIIGGLVLACIGPGISAAQQKQQQETPGPISALSRLSIMNQAHKIHQFEVELADRPDLRAQGLMFRRHMGDTQGMLFLFDRSRVVNMWMKNTYLPLDIIFIDRSGRIVHIARNTVPETLDIVSSQSPVISALEVNAGLTQRLGIAVGDMIQHEIFPVLK